MSIKKTLRVRTKDGWDTKPPVDAPENVLVAEEVDDNFLSLEDQQTAHEGALDPHDQYEQKTNLGTAAYEATTAFESAGAVSTHEGALDPHDQYTTTQQASDAAPVQSVDGKTGAVTLSADYEPRRQHNLTATSDPAVTDDSGAGYEPLSKWVNTTTGEVFICLDATAGAADWQLSTLTIDDLGSAATAETNDFTPAAHATDTTNPHNVTAAQTGAYTTTDADAQFGTGGIQDTHSGRTDNPHGVTAAQIGATPDTHPAETETHGAPVGERLVHTGDLGTSETQADTKYAHRANNLSDLDNSTTARTNLGGNAAGFRTVSTAGPSGGSNGDIWYEVD